MEIPAMGRKQYETITKAKTAGPKGTKRTSRRFTRRDPYNSHLFWSYFRNTTNWFDSKKSREKCQSGKQTRTLSLQQKENKASNPRVRRYIWNQRYWLDYLLCQQAARWLHSLLQHSADQRRAWTDRPKHWRIYEDIQLLVCQNKQFDRKSKFPQGTTQYQNHSV